METGTASCFAPLAADRLQRRPFASPTSPRKTRVQGFCRGASGRFSTRRRRSRAIATGCGACGYKTASGRGKWPKQRPVGGIWFSGYVAPTHKVLNNENDLYEFVMNSPTYTVDPDGRFAWLPVCCIACGAFAAWDIYDAIHDGTCAGLTGSDLASCLWNAVFNKAGLNELTSCLSGAILGGIQSGSSGSEIMSGVGDCFKCAGLKPRRDVGKMLSCGCCMGSILSRVPNPLPGPIRPVPQPAIALGAQ